jgi:lipid A 3-O-deacylase
VRKLNVPSLLLFSFLFSNISAQEINNFSSCRKINSENYFRLNYDNDFFTATDYYYSQGISMEFSSPVIKKFPLIKLLLRLNDQNRYGISFEHDAYTPTSIRHPEIIRDDRPFAACLMLNTFSSLTDTVRHTILSSEITLGLIGPAAFGEEIQKGIHKLLKNIQPLGWNHQIRNDAIVNYRIEYETEIIFKTHFLLSSSITMNAGTLTDNLASGLIFIAGKFNSPFNALNNKGNFSIYFYAEPFLKIVGYNATLQGGFFDGDSPYTIPASKVNRILFQDNAGVVISMNKIYLEYFQSFLTREFHTGKVHRWGGIKIGISFK